MKSLQVEIITIGDEILIGQVVDTNSAWLGVELNKRGFEVAQITSVHDGEADIVGALDGAFGRADVVLMTGGLGPTKDDRTKQILADYFGTTLVQNDDALQNIQRLHAHRPTVLNELTRAQAMVPESCMYIRNTVGTAPVMWFEHERKILVSMPGVPYEMKTAMTEAIFPRLEAHFRTTPIVHRTLVLYGIPESSLALRIAEWENQLPVHLRLAYLPNHGVLRLRLSAYSSHTIEVVEREIEEQIALVRPLIAEFLLVEADVSVEQLVAQRLLALRRTMATAESCTGGNAAHTMVQMAGSSAYFRGSVVAYDNEVKQRVLQVTEESLAEYGAVSQSVVEQMAQNARRILGADYALATSGIAGPTGGTDQKPVGTVWIAVASAERVVSSEFHFGSQRVPNMQRATQAALVMLLRMID